MMNTCAVNAWPDRSLETKRTDVAPRSAVMHVAPRGAMPSRAPHLQRWASQPMQFLPSTCRRWAVLLGVAVATTSAHASSMFTESSFAQIRFLEGKWKGIGPDGKEFFEEYVLAEPRLFRSIRYADSSFSKATDGSTVDLKEGAVVSTWGAFTWKASSISATKACFEPVNAPSSFCWERVEPDTVTATQRWTGADGKEQSFVLRLTRFRN